MQYFNCLEKNMRQLILSVHENNIPFMLETKYLLSLRTGRWIKIFKKSREKKHKINFLALRWL